MGAKMLLAGILCAVGVWGTQAQRVVNNADNKAYWGVRASFDLTMPGDAKVTYPNRDITVKDDTFNSNAGCSVEGVFNIPIVANFYIEPGMSLYYNTMVINKWSMQNLISYLEQSGIGGQVTTHSVRKTGMRIPAMAGYHFDFTPNLRLAVFTGPVLDIGFLMDEYYKVSTFEKSFAASMYKARDRYSEDRMQRTNLDWRVGIGVDIHRFFIACNWTAGLTNSYLVAEKNRKDYKIDFRQNYLQFSLGYNFR